MFDLGFVVDAEAVPVTLRTQGGDYDAGGKWVPTTAVDTTILATVQPTGGKQLLDLPEGLRSEAKYALWTRSALALDDVVIYGGANYRVIFAWPRPEGGFYKVALGLTT